MLTQSQLLDPRPVEGKIRQNGYYDPVRYRDWWYPKSARNPQEQEKKERPPDQSKTANGSSSSTTALGPNNGTSDSKEVHDLPSTAFHSMNTENHPTASADISKDASGSADSLKPKDKYDGRHLGPRYLCFRTDYIPDTKQQGKKSTTGNIDTNSTSHVTVHNSSTVLSSNIASSHQFPSPPNRTKGAGFSSSKDIVPHHSDSRYKTQKVQDWLDPEQGKTNAEYVFVSYTRAQFHVEYPAKGWKRSVPEGTEILYTDAEKQRITEQVKKDREYLIKFGLEASREAKVPAFWIDFECIKSDDSTSEGEAQARQQVTAAAVDQQQANTSTAASFGETGADSVTKVGFTSNYRCDQLF
jgi:hypothetical protein